MNDCSGLKKSIYYGYLQEISKIKFTFREIDVIVCIVHNRNDKKIAFLLSISPKTVGTHIYNLMQKLRCNSRDYIIDFIEKSGKLNFIKKYYSCLLLESNFENYLIKIGQINAQITIVKYNKNLHQKESLITKFTQHLKIANIFLEEDKNRIANIPTLNIEEKEYYSFVLEFIKNHLAKPQINQLINEFNYQNQIILDEIEKSVSGENCIPQDLKYNSLIHNLKNPYIRGLISICVLTIFSIAYIILQHKKINNRTEITDINYNFPDTKKILNKMHHSYSIIKQIEELIKITGEKNIDVYIASTELTTNELLHYLYLLQTLSNYYLYNDHDWEKARKILEHGKKMAEGYVIYISDLKFKFDRLSNKEIYEKLSVITDLTEMYTRIIYFLGRTYIYQGNKKGGIGYFKLSQYLGNKVGTFEEHLSKSNLEIIKGENIEDDIQSKNYKQARIKLDESIALYEELEKDINNYKLNYKPNSKKTEMIIPKKNFYNRVAASEKIIKCYTKLIYITEEHQQQQIYIRKIREQLSRKEDSDIFKYFSDLPNKKIASFCNAIAEALLEAYDKNLNTKQLERDIVIGLKLSESNNLGVIEQIYNLSNSLSKNFEFTKADSNAGLIKVYNRKIKTMKLTKQEESEFLLKIEKLKEEKDKINNTLKRTVLDKW